MNFSKQILIFNFLLLGFFAFSILSISVFTLFQVFVILYAFIIFLIERLRKYKYNKEFKSHDQNNIRFGFIDISIIILIFGFIISFIFSSSIQSSLKRLPIYAIVILIIPSSYYLFSKFNNQIKNIPLIYLIANIIVLFLIILINFLIIIKFKFDFKLILKERQVGFLRNAIGFSYCMIFPIYFLLFNQYMIIKKNKKNYNFLTLPLTVLSIIIQLFLVISSGSRTALFAIIFSIFIVIIFFLINNRKNILSFLILLFLIIIFLSLILYLFLPLSKSEIVISFYKNLNKYLIKNKLYTLRRINLSTKVLVKIFELFKNPSEIKLHNNSENFRVAAIFASLRIIGKKPLSGSGPFAWNYYIRQDKQIFDLFPENSLKHTHSHNDFLQILSEFGFIFFIGYFLLIIISIKNLISIIKKSYSFSNYLLISIFLILILGGLTDFLFGHPLIGPYYGLFLGVFLSMNKSGNIRFNMKIKRLFDIIISFFAIIIFSPLFILISFLIVIESGFPILYKQKRMGKNYKEFILYKFRSMIKDADKKGALVTASHDPRITKTGKFLRKTKLDELPQFFNVLRGDMSIVGPRPEVEKYAKYYKKDFEYILSRVKPGITDESSIQYRNEEKILANKENHEEIYINELLPKKLILAREYADNNNIIKDFYILLKTIFVVLLKH